MKISIALYAGIQSEIAKLIHYKLVWILTALAVFCAVYFSLFRIDCVMKWFSHFNIVISNGIIYNDMDSYFSMAKMMLYQLLTFGGGITTGWLFGMEYTNKTVKDLLALPCSRQSIVFAKFSVIFMFSVFIAVCQFVFFCVMGIAAPLANGWLWGDLLIIVKQYAVITAMSLLLFPFMGFLAVLSRGYLLPFGIVLFMGILSSFVGFIGRFMEYFPWTIQWYYLLTGTTAAVSIVILLFMGLVGYIATMLLWCYVDHNR